MGKKRTIRRDTSGPQYRKNQRIRVPEVRLIDEEGEQAGVVDTNEARRRAKELGLDLVEVSPQARPPVCKIMDYGKFLYQQRKKEKTNQSASKGSSQLKELRVRPAIDTHDLSYRLDNGRKFLTSGHKVQVVCIFKGRQMAHPEHGFEVMKTVSENLKDVCKVEVPAKMMGRRMTMLLTPIAASQRVKGASTTPKREKKDAAKGPDGDKAPEPKGQDAPPEEANVEVTEEAKEVAEKSAAKAEDSPADQPAKE